MKYLITGCAGFIGFHVAKYLINEGNHVIGVDSMNKYYDVELKKNRIKNIKKNKLSKNFKFFQFNVSNKKKLKKLFIDNNFDIVIHLAAQAGVRYSMKNPFSYISNNILATTNLLEMCKTYPPKNVLIASSSSVYGIQNQQKFTENLKTNKPLSFYAATKISIESIAHSYSHLYDLPIKILRFFTVYGPWGRPDMAYFTFTKNIIENRKINIFNNGNHFRDFTYISDIVNFIDTVSKKNKSKKFDILNFGSNNPEKLSTFISLIENKLKIKAKKNFIKMQDGDMIGTHASMIYSRKNYNLKAKIQLKMGISRFIDWYKKYYSLTKK